jgi:hypothetical protein
MPYQLAKKPRMSQEAIIKGQQNNKSSIVQR